MYGKSAILVGLIIAMAGATAGISATLMLSNQSQEKMPAFSSYSELSSFLDGASNGQGSLFYGGEPMKGGIGQQDETSALAPSYSKTNVQVEGIDEADIVKTDGEFIYSASHNSISIIRAYPPNNMSVVATIEASDLMDQANATVRRANASYMDLSIDGLYLLQDRLIVVCYLYIWSNYYGGGYRALGISTANSAEQTMISVYDVGEIVAPSPINTFSISGYPITSRMQDGVIYSVSQFYIQKDADGGYGVPETSDDRSEMRAIPAGDIHYDPETEDAGYFLNILSVDVQELKSKSKSIVAGWASTIYMSPDSLFLTMVKWPEMPAVLLTDTAARTMAGEDNTPTTKVYRVDVDGLSMHISAKGSVRGLLLDQFSMDERNGCLRVATSSGDWLDRRNAVYVLDSNLTMVGSIEDIAVNETIQSSRFVGDALYLVTFRQVDPLFVIDLSIPEAPKILGELTVPGFSTYLHPVDSGHILGIGSEGSSAKISLYDVSDPTAPSEVSTYLVGNNSYSTAGWEYKAVLFDAEKELLVIPVSVYDYEHWNSSSGFYVFKVSVESGISLRGIIAHNNSGYYRSDSDRALYIGDYLYTVSDTTVKANLMSNLSEISELVYCEQPYCFWGYGSAVGAEALAG